jgi:hypothetical protein
MTKVWVNIYREEKTDRIVFGVDSDTKEAAEEMKPFSAVNGFIYLTTLEMSFKDYQIVTDEYFNIKEE